MDEYLTNAALEDASLHMNASAPGVYQALLWKNWLTNTAPC